VGTGTLSVHSCEELAACLLRIHDRPFNPMHVKACTRTDPHVNTRPMHIQAYIHSEPHPKANQPSPSPRMRGTSKAKPASRPSGMPNR
jgi:hypothetical protein